MVTAGTMRLAKAECSQLWQHDHASCSARGKVENDPGSAIKNMIQQKNQSKTPFKINRTKLHCRIEKNRIHWEGSFASANRPPARPWNLTPRGVQHTWPTCNRTEQTAQAEHQSTCRTSLSLTQGWYKIEVRCEVDKEKVATKDCALFVAYLIRL